MREPSCNSDTASTRLRWWRDFVYIFAFPLAMALLMVLLLWVVCSAAGQIVDVLALLLLGGLTFCLTVLLMSPLEQLIDRRKARDPQPPSTRHQQCARETRYAFEMMFGVFLLIIAPPGITFFVVLGSYLAMRALRPAFAFEPWFVSISAVTYLAILFAIIFIERRGGVIHRVGGAVERLMLRWHGQ